MKKIAVASLFLTVLIVFLGIQMLGEIDTAIEEEQGITTAKAEMDFTEGVWIKKYPGNYACFKLESPDGYQIVCDPYQIDEWLEPNLVLESHQHMDHIDPTNLELSFQLIKGPEALQNEYVELQGYAGKHNKGDTENTNNIFVIKMNDITIAHFASQGEIPNDEVLKQIGTVDVLLIQVFTNPYYDKLLPREVDSIINKLKPKIVIPEHGEVSIGSKLAENYNVAEEVETSGNIVVTRAMLDEADDIRILTLDN